MIDTHELRARIADVRAGCLSRRAFVETMVALGLTAPLAQQLLRSRVATAQPRPSMPAAKSGGRGPLKALWWQAPTLLNPHLAIGLKDADGSRLFYEPLVAFDAEGALVPVLATEVPTVENGGVARDGLSVTCKLKRDVAWHDGRALSADDVVFNWEYAADPATTAATLASYERVERMEAIDSHTVKIVFKRPTPFWAQVAIALIVPKHVFQAHRGQRAREAPANLKPIGTGPYRIVDFRPGDFIKAEINPHYHIAGRPFFDTIDVKGGGDAVSAARAVLQTGEYDYAWNLQVEDDVLKRLERGGKGRIAITFGGVIEHIQVNQTDPWTEIDGERSSGKSVHPFLTDSAVRQALVLLVDRASIETEIYGRAGKATANYVNAPARFVSKATSWEFDVDKAARALEAAGWKRGPDGIRTRDGRRLRMVFQSSINGARQKAQAIFKQAAGRAGIDVELKAVAPAAYFSSDPANTDTASHFYADLQMLAIFMGAPDPQGMLRAFTSAEIATRANRWQRRNTTRWRNEEYDRLFSAAETEMDPVKRAAMFIRMNDMIVKNAVVIPLVWRGTVSAISNRLKDVVLSGWDSDFWRIAWWRT